MHVPFLISGPLDVAYVAHFAIGLSRRGEHAQRPPTASNRIDAYGGGGGGIRGA